jgi:transcriptional regulator with XRE-family HTH domain
MKLQDAIREKREAAGLSVSEAARRAGLHRLHWHQLETGLRDPTVKTIYKIAGALKMKPGDLLNLAERRA